MTRLVELSVSNFMRVHAVRIRPDRKVIEITGKNASGKSSLLRALYVALGGDDASPEVPVRKGESKAVVKADLGDIVITRTYTPTEDGSYNTTLTVESADGARFPSPQKLLNSLLSSLSFDPMQFSRMAPKDQFDALRPFVKGVDFDQIARMRAEAYDKRRNASRKAREAETAANAIAVPIESKRVDVDVLVKKLAEAGDKNAKRAALYEKWKSLSERMSRITEQLDALQKEHAELSEQLKALPKPGKEIDVSDLRDEITRARKANEAADLFDRKAEYLADAAKWSKESNALDAEIIALDSAKAEAIAAAKFPVKGLTLGDGEVMLNGLPFAQASEAERLTAGVEMAMSNDPKLRLVCIADGSAMDTDTFKVLEALAEKHDFQVIVETVNSCGRVAVEIADGSVKQ